MHRLGLVSARNGFGHARRLLNLAIGFIEVGLEVRMFVTSRQKELLQQEINLFSNLTGMLKVITIGDYGIDTIDPKFFRRDELNRPERLVIQSLQSCDAVISDNSFWPAEYVKEFYLLGHFDWIRFWQLQKNKNLQGIQDDFLDGYAHFWWPKVKAWFRTVDFGWPAPEGVRTIDIPLIRYYTDAIETSTSNRELNPVWIAYGTTGDRLFTPSEIDFGGLVTIQRESFHLHTTKHKPHFLIGRPGLGTIRDCLSTGTIFLPCGLGTNPELVKNAIELDKFGLIPSYWVEDIQSSHRLLIREDFHSKLEDYHEALNVYWSYKSQNAVDVASSIFRSITLAV